jgi:hypothetical protein
MINRKHLAAAAVALAAAGIASTAGTALAASGDTAAFTQQVQNRPDSGADGNVWAYDSLFRTVKVTDQGVTATAGTELFQVTVSDEGTFQARQGQKTPSGTDAATAVITHPVKGSVAGSVTYTVTAPAGSLKPSQALASEDDHFADTPATTTAGLALEPFTSGATVTATGDWSYTYKTAAGETWVNGSAGNTGNITGLLPAKPPAAPVLSHGHAGAQTPNREKVYFTSDSVTWVHFQIAGPGPINGHEGWVHAVKGENFGYYSGLNGNHHTYAVFYTPVASQGSEIPTGNEGHVTFVTDPNA